MREAVLRPGRAATLTCFAVILLVSAAYQACYCYAISGGDLTGLFFIGGRTPQPPQLAAGFSYPGSRGYDGQFYRILAHDPLMRKGYGIYLDDARYRSRRILIPGMAALLGAGSPVAVDFWYVAVTDVAIALGGVCFVMLAFPCCRPAVAVVLYLLIPAVIAGTDRMLPDAPAVAGFLAAYLFLRDDRFIPLMAVLCAMPLIREANLCVTAGCICVLLRDRNWRRTVWCAMTLIPSLVWWWFVAAHTARSTAASQLISVPLLPQVLRLFTRLQRPVGPLENFLLQSLDVVACLCLLMGFAWVMKTIVEESWRGEGLRYDTLLILPAAILAAFTGGQEVLAAPYAFMRVNSMLVAWTALRMLCARPVWARIYVPASSLALLVYRANPLLKLVGRMIG